VGRRMKIFGIRDNGSFFRYCSVVCLGTFLLFKVKLVLLFNKFLGDNGAVSTILVLGFSLVLQLHDFNVIRKELMVRYLSQKFSIRATVSYYFAGLVFAWLGFLGALAINDIAIGWPTSELIFTEFSLTTLFFITLSLLVALGFSKRFVGLTEDIDYSPYHESLSALRCLFVSYRGNKSCLDDDYKDLLSEARQYLHTISKSVSKYSRRDSLENIQDFITNVATLRKFIVSPLLDGSQTLWSAFVHDKPKTNPARKANESYHWLLNPKLSDCT